MTMRALDKFGKIMIERVRDQSITEWEAIIDDRMPCAENVRAFVQELTPEQREKSMHLIKQVVDTAMHYFLWTLEEEPDIDVSVRSDDGNVTNAREVSDGLAGELYDWISRFSPRPYER